MLTGYSLMEQISMITCPLLVAGAIFLTISSKDEIEVQIRTRSAPFTASVKSAVSTFNSL